MHKILLHVKFYSNPVLTRGLLMLNMVRDVLTNDTMSKRN